MSYALNTKFPFMLICAKPFHSRDAQHTQIHARLPIHMNCVVMLRFDRNPLGKLLLIWNSDFFRFID